MPKVLQFPRTVAIPERRRFQRHSIEACCLIKVGSSKSPKQHLFLGEAVNGSRGGYLFIARDSSAWEIGAQIECIIQLPASEQRQIAMRFTGKVVRLVRQDQDRIGLGVMIDDLSLPVTSQSNTRSERRRASLEVPPRAVIKMAA